MKRCSKCKKEKLLSDFHQSGKSLWCKDCKNDWSRQSYSMNKEHYKKQKSIYHRNLKLDILGHYGSICTCCGEAKQEFLSIDHIDGNGNKHRKVWKDQGGRQFYLWIKRHNYPDNLRILCMNCNFAIGHFGYCPHRLEWGNYAYSA